MECNTNELISGNSKLVFKGPNIDELILDNVKVIRSQPECTNPLLHGCYLMYPWVGRLTDDSKIKTILGREDVKYPFLDSKGYPLHGFFQTAEREVISKGDDFIILTAKDRELFKYFPRFEETYKLIARGLSITTEFRNETTVDQYFAYSYHPYIGINDKPIDGLSMTYNFTEQYELTEELVPKVDTPGNLCKSKFKFEQLNLGSTEFDNMFLCEEANPFVKLSDGICSVTVSGSGELKMPFMQLYTPPDRKSLAIEPMTSPSNAFNIQFPDYLVKLEPGKKASGKIEILLEK
jgi:aldose 1-epimerase